MIKNYWSIHHWADPICAVLIAACLWLAPSFGVEPWFFSEPHGLSDTLGRWLAGCLTLIGLIIATTGFFSSLLQTSDFAPLAKSASVAQLWEILRQNLGWLFIASVFSAAGTFSDFRGKSFLFFAGSGTAILVVVIISLAKRVWVMRSVLSVKISRAKQS